MLRFIEGFDSYTTVSQRWDIVRNSPSIGAGGRTGNRLVLNGGSSGAEVQRRFSPIATVVVGTAVKISAAFAGQSGYIRFYEGTTLHLDLRVTAFGAVVVTRNGTVLATSANGVILPGVWQYTEFKAAIHDTLGSFEVRVNGATVLSASGVDTRNGGTGVVDNLHLQTGIDNGGVNVEFDDLYIDDADFLGDVKVETIRPTGAGAHTDFTPSTGSNWQNVDDAAPDDDSTYNSSGTAAAKDSFAMGDLVTTGGSVKGIQQNIRLRKDDAGSRTAKQFVRVGLTDYEGAAITTFDSYVSLSEVVEQNPATAADWTISEVNALEAGYEVVA